MSPKLAKISISLAILVLATTLSSAHTDCPGYDSVADVLRHYDIPAGLFPNDVKYFHCDPLNKDALRLSIELHGVCKVSRSMLGVGNVVECQPHMSAIISYQHLTDIKGVTVTLTFNDKPVGELMTVTEAKIQKAVIGKFLEFNSDKGPSPWFPVFLIQDPPTCDARAFDYSGSAGEVAKHNNIPSWVYNYGRPLLLVA